MLPRLWLMNRMAERWRCRSSRTRSSTAASTVTSRPVVGSSMADRAQRRVVERDEVAPLEEDAPARDAAVAAQVAHDRERHRRLAAARLAHEAERLAGAELEVEPGEHQHLARARGIGDAQALDV